ncbi:MAG: hypothetical protein ABIZ80_12005, partial [Bryobacteraceae bacterium]
MKRRGFLSGLTVAGMARAADDGPEKKSPTEALDLQKKIEDTMAGRRPPEPLAYPYFSPDYKLPFTHIGTEKQLVLDNFILGSLQGVERVIGRPKKHPRALIENTNLPWEKGGFIGGIVGMLFDPDDRKFKLWYNQSLSGDLYGSGMVLCYAESVDGLNWHKLITEKGMPFKEHRATNIVNNDETSAAALVLNHDRRDPSRKFLLVYEPIAEARKQGVRILSRVAASPDGLKWTVIASDAKERRRHGPAFWDEAIQQWVCYSQHSPHWHFGPRIRQVGRQTSPDFIHWSPKEVVLSTDWDPMLGPDREFHDASVRKVGGTYIALVAEAHTDPLWSSRTKAVRGMYPDTVWRDQFHVSLALYCSRDGRRFERAHGPEPWVDNGPPGSPDHGFVASTGNDDLYHNGKMIISYGAGPLKQWSLPREDWDIVPKAAREKMERDMVEAKKLGDYGEGPGRRQRSSRALVLREDGWAMLKPRTERGQAITKQFVFAGKQLRVNADCQFGSIRVELLNPRFEPYAGFSAEDCDVLHDENPDRIWYTVSWKGQNDVSALWNKPVMIRFEMFESALY